MPRIAVIVCTAVAAIASTLVPARVHAADPIFSQDVLHEVRLVMDPADWQALRQNFRTNDYYAANLAIDGEVVQQIGVRSRGQGSRSGEKPALKLDINKYQAGQEFHGYKSIILKNLVQDASGIRERLAFAVFEAMGIGAPQNSHARVTVNDEYWGVYEITEDVTKPFLQARLGEDGGNLYKYQYEFAYFFGLRGSDTSGYVPVPFEPETNEDKHDASGLLAFVQAINGGSDATFARDIGTFIDVTRFLTHVAVENAIAERDGFLGYAGMNNFYLYQFKGQNRFVLLPWDKDGAFVGGEWPVLSNVDANVLTRRLFADPAQKTVYLEAVKKAATSFVTSTYLGPLLEKAYSQIREAMLLDKHKPFTNEQFELGVGGLRGVIGARAADVSKQVP